MLTKYVQGSLVDYSALKSDPADLIKFLSDAQSVSKEEYQTWNSQRQTAFWLNVYNAAIMKTVIDHYPIAPGFSLKGLAYPKNSIQQIANVWDKKSSNFLGRPMSPNNIEHDTLRKDFDEPRIHFALVCASAGCPPIRREAYTSAYLDTQLEDQVNLFLSDTDKNRISGNTIEISKIFKWFEADFGGIQGVKSFISSRKPDWKVDDSTSVRYLDYDWSLNEL